MRICGDKQSQVENSGQLQLESVYMASQQTFLLPSPLDKPLHQLTEEDISQLTREDCRRYLKSKGMRRPSWNKSQAIQQVISLKTLLEATPDSDAAGARKKLHIYRRDTSYSSPKAASGNSPSSPSSAEETVPNYQAKYSEKSDHLSDDVLACHVPASEKNDSILPRISEAAKVSAGQLTIFYCGKVNVYDDVPADKARLLKELVASPLHFPLEDPFDGAAARQTLPAIFQLSSVKSGVDPPVPSLISMNLTDNSRLHREESDTNQEANLDTDTNQEANLATEGPANRKLSVQRYLEKRKDRFKRKIAPSSSASMDVYLNHQTGYHTSSYHAIRSITCSPTQIRSHEMSDCCDNNSINDPKLSPALSHKGGTYNRMMRNDL